MIKNKSTLFSLKEIYKKVFNIEFSYQELTAILSSSKRVFLKKGKSISQDNYGPGVFVISRGNVLYSKKLSSKEKLSTTILAPGSLIREIETIKSNGNIQALNDLDLFFIDETTLQSNKDKWLTFMNFVKFTEVNVTHKVFDMMMLRSQLSKREHIILMLSLYFKALRPINIDTLDISIEDAASLSGTTRQYYSKAVNELISLKIIEHSYSTIKLISYEKLIALNKGTALSTIDKIIEHGERCI
ncbi:Crp/Fnr family transcriptional regulator [Shewanella sp. TC10]|uniref:Crp/Fnr family transcriptional regulator n=1 Tax=Shewanella sp. TC10 TaxID=1419739 RepID=UPI00129D923D|nr:Crp/Fnr family transcriptional regulator [Shewanella sp. TC10]